MAEQNAERKRIERIDIGDPSQPVRLISGTSCPETGEPAAPADCPHRDVCTFPKIVARAESIAGGEKILGHLLFSDVPHCRKDQSYGIFKPAA